VYTPAGVFYLTNNERFHVVSHIIAGGSVVAVRIRLQRVGAKNRPFYRVVVVDERKKRDGSVIENIGQYQPVTKESAFNVKEERVLDWLKKGAQPTVTVVELLRKNGIWAKHQGSK
jgi:small subunit ribosomal protein S16